MADPTSIKRRELSDFIAQVLAPHPAIQGVVGIGSIATGRARPDSDIDAFVFLDPLDLFIVPAECIWRPSDGTFHSIFQDVDGVQLDFKRCDLARWADPAFAWPEGYCAELADGWIAYDREGRIAPLIAARTTYGDDTRIKCLDEAITWLDQHLDAGTPEQCWEQLGPAIAHDRLHAAYGYLVQLLFAYNRRWQPWRNREMSYLLALPWLPRDFAERALVALNPPSLDFGGLMARAAMLAALFQETVEQLIADGDYADDPIGEAFVRAHEEPGRAWNMDAWNAERLRRHGRAS
jgi:hypothetical protein